MVTEERARRSTTVADRRRNKEDAPVSDGDNAGQRKGSRLSGAEAIERAKEQVVQLIGRPVDSVSGLARADRGWRVRVDIVELERIPPTTNVMGSYEVELDDRGELVGYELLHRYHRGQVGEEER